MEIRSSKIKDGPSVTVKGTLTFYFVIDDHGKGFKGTPSVVVVDRFGSVKSISLGKLTAEDESQMIASLDNVTGKTSISTDKRAVSLKEVETLRIKNKVVVLDIREREAYSREHLAGTVNIPIDELEARAVK